MLPEIEVSSGPQRTLAGKIKLHCATLAGEIQTVLKKKYIYFFKHTLARESHPAGRRGKH